MRRRGILDSKQEPVAALTVSGPSFRISGKKMEQIVAELNRCCREIESKLAGNPFV